jgi:hypothetical protein
MRLLPGLRTLLAISIALLLPIEQAHCAWMGVQKSVAATAASAPAAHACCAPAAETAPAPQPAKTPQACVCEQLPPGALPNLLHGAQAPAAASIAMPAAPAVIAPVATVTATVPVLDVGSPPLPDDPGAHGLRAPPASA